MANSLRLHVLAPEQTILEVESVGWVRLCLVNGERISIHPRHAPLAAETAYGELEYAQGGLTHRVLVGPALLRVQNDEVVLFAGIVASQAEVQVPSRTQALPRLIREVAAQADGVVPQGRRAENGKGNSL